MARQKKARTETPTKTVDKIVKIPGDYQVSITIGETVSDFETGDLVATFLEFKPETLKTKVLLRIKKGERSFEKVLLPRFARRLFSSEDYARIYTKHITSLLG